MSSISFESNTLPELLSLRSQIDARVSVLCGGDSAVVAASSAAGAKSKKPSARAGKPTAYGAFSSKIQKENADEIKAFKEANPEMKGAHMAWVGKYKEEHPDIYEAFKTEWAAANPKAEAPTSEAASADEGGGAPVVAEKPKKVLSPEHLAKMKAGREAKKAAKDAEKAAAGTESSSDEAAGGGGGGGGGGPVAAEKPKKVLSPEHLAKLKAGREAKKAAKDAEKAAAEAEAKGESPIALSPAAPAEVPVKAAKKPKEAKKAAPVAEVAAPVAEVAAPVAEVAAPAAEQEAEALPFKLGGATYIRMGISKPDGNHEWLSGDLWLSKKGARGSYAGELMEDGSINADAEEPTLS